MARNWPSTIGEFLDEYGQRFDVVSWRYEPTGLYGSGLTIKFRCDVCQERWDFYTWVGRIDTVVPELREELAKHACKDLF